MGHWAAKPPNHGFSTQTTELQIFHTIHSSTQRSLYVDRIPQGFLLHAMKITKDPFQNLIRHLIIRSCTVWNPRDWLFKIPISVKFGRCLGHSAAWQIPQPLENSKHQSHILWILPILWKEVLWSLIRYWNGPQFTTSHATSAEKR